MLNIMKKIDIFNNSAIILLKRTPNKILNSMYIIILFVIVVIMFSLLYKYPKYSYYQAIVEKDNNDYVISIVLKEAELPFNKGNSIVIDNKKVKIKNIEVSDVNYDNMGNQYRIIKLKVNIDDKIKINHNIVDVHIYKGDTTIFKELWKKVKKGLM